MKSEFHEIETQDQMDSFLDLLGDCHDGIIREIHIVNRSFVDDKSTMHCGLGYSLRILLQRQWNNPSAVEIILDDVIRMKIDELNEIYSASGWIEQSHATGIPEIHLDLDGAKFVSRKMIFREASEWIGRPTRFGEYFSGNIPRTEATHLDGGWVMCPSCTESWELLVKQTLIACPYCNTALLLQKKSISSHIDPDSR